MRSGSRRTVMLAALVISALAGPTWSGAAEKASKQAGPLQSLELPVNNMVAIVYGETDVKAHQALRERLSKRQVLEQVQAFLSPLRLPRVVTIELQTCKRIAAVYVKGRIIICYEIVEQMRSSSLLAKTPKGVAPEDVVISGFVAVMLHEVAHAVFDILDIPILGREEDAADQLAGFVMVQFGSGLARRLIGAKAYIFDYAGANRRARSKQEYADVHGTEYQRFYNILCIAYGHDKETFSDYVKRKVLPRSRAERCEAEYVKLLKAFRALILPHIDRELMEKVRKVEWLLPEDGKL